jgi:hypothetical protein
MLLDTTGMVNELFIATRVLFSAVTFTIATATSPELITPEALKLVPTVNGKLGSYESSAGARIVGAGGVPIVGVRICGAAFRFCKIGYPFRTAAGGLPFVTVSQV